MNDSGFLRSASGSFHVSSRPPSRAWSDSTERPDSSHSTVVGGPRSISQEIEHIKRLITRAESNRQQISGSITAVVFRNKKQEPVAKEHIFHELDALRRRIKYEQQQAAEKAKEQEHALVRRASQIDPGAESESEVESVLDERDEELEKANEALEVQRERFESLLENAEERVDLLTGQRDALHLEKAHLEETFQNDKDRLERLLNDERKRLQTEQAKLEQELKQERDNRDHVLQSAEERLDRLTEEKEIAKARTNHLIEERDLLKSELEKLATETGKLEADVVREKERLKGELGDTKAQLTRATKEKTSLNNELEATRKWVEELNAKLEDGARSLQEKSKAFDDLRTEKRSTDVAHKSAQEEILRLHALKSDVEASLRDTSAKLSKLERENKDAAAYLEKFTAERGDAEKALQEKLQQAHGRCDTLTAELAQQEQLGTELKQKLSAVEAKHETATKHAVDLGLKYEEATKTADELRATHEMELERVRAEEAARLKESEDQHAYEKAELKAEHSEQMDQLRREHAQNLLASLRTERESVQKEAQVELDGVKATHAEQLRTKSAELDEMKIVRDELRKKRDDLQKEAYSSRNTIKVLQQQNSDTEQASQKRLTDVDALHAETMQQERTRTQQEISELQRQLQEKKTVHEQSLISVKSEHEAELQQLVAKYTEASSAASTVAERKVSELEEDHLRTVARLKDEHVAALEGKTTEHSKALDDLVAEHEQDRQKALAKHEEAEAKLREQLEEATSHSTTAAATHEEALAELRADHSNELESLKAQHHAQQQAKEKDVSDLKEELARAHEEALVKVRAEHSDVTTRLEAQHHAQQHARDKVTSDLKEDFFRLRAEHLSAANASRENDESGKRELVAEHDRLTQQIRDAHAEELQQARLKWAAEIEDLQAKNATEKDQMRLEVEDALSRVGKAQAAHDAVLEDLKTKHSAELKAVNASLTDEATRHEQTVAAHDAKLVQLQAEHRDAIDMIKSEHSTHIHATKTAAHESLERNHKAAISKLTQEHEEQMARLHERSNKSDHDRTRLQRETEGASREAGYKAEVEALQVRLDATMTGQAEAERSLAALRQQLVTADKRIADAKSGNEEQIAALVSEKDDLTTQLERVQLSLRELQRKHSGGSATPRASVAIREEVAELVAQVTTLEEERSTMQAMLKKRQEEKNEVSRQNEFLVKELEMLLQQRSRPRESSRSSSNALVQTEDMTVEPKADMASFTPIKAARRNTSSSRPMTPLSPGVRQARADVEAAWQSRSFEDYLDNARAELSELGSVISANEALFARKIDEHVSELQRAKDELQADYNAKVASLAKDKDTMEQIISSEQQAQFVKDRKKLIAKYGADFQDPAERSAMLTSLPMDTAVALRTAEQKLVDDYNKRITKRKSQIALKHAEEFQNITRDYDRRVSVLLNTRSRLEGDLSVDPSKFEAEYGDITNKSEQLFAKRKSNIDAPRAARKSDDVPVLSRHASMQSQSPPHLPLKDLEVDRARPRTRERTSSPRTEQSLPRSSSRPREFFPGSRDSPEATSQPMKARRGSNKHPPVPQHFLMRTKEAADFFAPPRVVSDASPEPNIPRSPRGRPQSRADSRINHSLGYEPSGTEAQQDAYADRRIVSLQEKSPSILRKIKDKISPVSSRPSSSSGRPSSSSGNTPSKSNSKSWRAHIHKRSKSRHLSSGMIYYNDPAKHPPPTTYHS
ncbi:hypothetical protein CBER1_08530 [Cercospora berteroae]|uniref:Uncharacterized protein n=1 Tax=Cercospora berteroae TaxID=357750 RepID=A0A2S6BUM2_9PEZI|nr:hypothetical protein CBER1_08530 [Cercospora berteroae]